MCPRSSVPQGCIPVRTRLVYAEKFDEHGQLIKTRCRITPLGFLQREGIDYFTTAAPTGAKVSLRVLLSLAAANDWEIHQADVNTAFLLAPIDVDNLYIEIPTGIGELMGWPDHSVLLLNKALYGLKQAPKVWNDTLNDYLTKEVKLKRSSLDPCVYYQLNQDGTLKGGIHLHVDDNT